VSAFGDPPRQGAIEVNGRSARIVIRAADVPAPRVVRGHAEIDEHGRITVGHDREVEIHCPPGTDVTVASNSGNVVCDGVFGKVFASTCSGDVRIDNAESVDVRTNSADVDVECCAGRCEVVGQSGRIDIGSARSVVVSTASGVTSIGGAVDAMVRSASGDVHVVAQPAGSVDVCTMSGAVTVELEGFRPNATLQSKSGRIRSPEATAAPAGELRVRTQSGSITVE
jgi:DUF4097 and DUF4098 domain-containing protein YvlB